MNLKKPGALNGALIGAAITAPLIMIMHLGWKLAGLPFAPFDLFDWLTRKLPGSVITFGIDSMIKVIQTLKPGGTADVAKAAEQAMAIAILLVAGTIAAAFLFAVLRAQKRPGIFPGVIVGGIFGLAMVLISLNLDRATTLSPLFGGFWTLASFLVWGTTIGWIQAKLSVRSEPASGPIPDDKREVERLDRRHFLIRMGGSAAVITVAGAVLDALFAGTRRGENLKSERWSALYPLPNVGDPVKAAPGTRPEFTPLENHYRIDINTTPLIIKEKDWRLRIGGLVERPLELTLDDIRSYRAIHEFVTLSCISNPIAGDLIGTTRWTGVSLQQVLPDLKLKPEATHLKINSADGFSEVVPLATITDDKRIMLAYAWDGLPLAVEHGFPLRIYIPDRYGMKQPKWIESIEATSAWEAGYWVLRGWDREARMKATSVIDTVAVKDAARNAQGGRFVPVGGIAHAGARGISKVELRVDGGEWREAQLRTPLSGLTWVIWRYDMPFLPGAHTLTVRCSESDGIPQIVKESPPHSSGATGLHSKTAKL